MQSIRIVDLEVFAHHGVFAEEKRDGQKFLVCAELTLKSTPAQDDLRLTIDYAEVCRRMVDFMTEHSFDLIETVSDQLCRVLLGNYPQLSQVCVEVKKPDAPIGLPLKFVSAVAERARHTAFLGLGGNMGNREQYLSDALKKLDANGDCRVKKVSAYILTKAYGKTDQADFLNAVCQIETVLEPLELLETLHTIEAEAGRVRVERWGARTLDLDILFYDDLICNEPALTIPHPDLHNRSFVLQPLCEIAPDYRHPVCKQRMTQLLERLKGK